MTKSLNRPIFSMLNVKEYHRPQGLTEAIELLRRKEVRTVAMGGGTWLIGEAPRDVEAVVDVADLGLNKIVVEDNPPRGTRIRISLPARGAGA